MFVFAGMNIFVKNQTTFLVTAGKISNAAWDKISLYVDTTTKNISKQSFANAVIRWTVMGK